MSVPSFVSWLLALSAASLAVFAWAQPPTDAKPPAAVEPTSVASLEKQLPVGHLGVPLGTVVRVTGKAFDGSETILKANAGKTLIHIVTVNGKALAESVDFEFLRASKSVKKPAPGEKFDYYVHEYGEIDGWVTPPKELRIESSLPIANDGFHYRRHLTVHASNVGQK